MPEFTRATACWISTASPIDSATDVAKVLVRIGAWSRAKYRLQSRGVELTATLVVAEQPLDRAILYQYVVGTAYLIIGLFVYFRRGSAQKARHFYILCLASFISLCFHYTGQLNTFDKVIYFGNVVAGLLAPTVFLHFCLTFPGTAAVVPRRRARTVLLYVPAALLFLAFVAFTSGAMKISVPLVELRWMLDRAWMVAWTLPYLIGALVLSRRIPPDRRPDRAAAVEVAAQRRVLRHPALRRCSTCCRTCWARCRTRT